MTKLQRLYAEQGQSPWLDNLTRGYLRDGTLARMVGDGIRGVTGNPTIFARAIEGSARYIDELIGPDTVNTLPETAIAAFEDHGNLARTIDAGLENASDVTYRLAAVGVDMDDVGLTLEDNGVAGFHEAFEHMLASLDARARQLSSR